MDTWTRDIHLWIKADLPFLPQPLRLPPRLRARRRWTVLLCHRRIQGLERAPDRRYLRTILSTYERTSGTLTLPLQALQAAVQRIEGYVKNLEEEVITKK